MNFLIYFVIGRQFNIFNALATPNTVNVGYTYSCKNSVFEIDLTIKKLKQLS